MPSLLKLASCLDLPDAPVQTYHLPADKRLHGDPLQTLWLQHRDASGQFVAGLWRSEPGTWRVAYTEDEYCLVLEGRSVVTDADGQAVTVGAGDSFVIPRGFVGTWEVLETTSKRFVLFEPSEPSELASAG